MELPNLVAPLLAVPNLVAPLPEVPAWVAPLLEVPALLAELRNAVAVVTAVTVCRTLESKTGSESSSTEALQTKFKLDLISLYLQPCGVLPAQLRCMVSGLMLDSDLVIAAHLNAASREKVGDHSVLPFKECISAVICALPFG